MTDFRKADISKQESYDLLRDWIKLVARHTNPDQDISELLGWLWKLKPATPDPATGLMPCGCGGKAVVVPKDNGFYIVCDSCEVSTAQDSFFNGTGFSAQSLDDAREDWNTAMGWRVEG